MDNRKLVPDFKSFQKIMMSQEMGNDLVNIGNKLTSGDGRYSVNKWEARKDRIVVNIADKNPDAISNEFKTGKMAAMITKRID